MSPLWPKQAEEENQDKNINLNLSNQPNRKVSKIKRNPTSSTGVNRLDSTHS